MSSGVAPISTVDSEAWSPSMPNSDMFTLSSVLEAAAEETSPIMRGRSVVIQRRGTALRSSPLGRFTPITPTTMAPASTAALACLKHKLLSDLESDIPASAQSSSRRTMIGLGHPSTSKRCAPLESDDVVDPPQQKCPRIDSSTIKCRTERFPARTLDIIAEYPATTTQNASTPRPVLEAHKRSYARAGNISAHTPRNGGRVAHAIPTTFIPSSSRCARDHPGGTSISSIPVLAPRSTSAGAPQAGPAQVQSPRVLLPATMAGAPNFQSLDGAMLDIAVATREERGMVELAVEAKETENFERGGMDGLMYAEDGFIKFKVHTRLRIRFAARRLKTLF